MKLAVIGPVYPFRGGIAHYTSKLSSSLMDSDHETHVISFKRQYPAWLYPGKSDKDPSQVGLRLKANYTLDPIYPWTWFNAAHTINEINPDGIIIQWWTTFWAPAYWGLINLLHRKRLKIVFIIHNVLPHEKKPWDAWFARQVLRLGDNHIVQTSKEEQRLLSLLPAAQPTLCSHPIYNIFPVDNSITKNKAREILNVVTENPILLFFGIIRPYKGLKYAIETVSNLRNEGTNVHMIVAGEFWEDIHKYEEQISNLELTNQVTLINRYIPDEEIGTIFTAADIFIAPYIGGTQSGVVTIAFNFDLPIVITENIFDELIMSNSTTRVVPPGNSQKLAEATAELLSIKRQDQSATEEADNSWLQLVTTIEELINQGEPNIKRTDQK